MDTENFANTIHRNLATRKRELTSIRLTVQESEPDSPHISWMSRTAAVFSYAHWEGFVKHASAKYLKYISSKKICVNKLHISLQAGCLVSHFKRANGSVKVAHVASVLAEMDTQRCESFAASDQAINTESNLSSKVFQDLVLGLGLEYQSLYSTRRAFVDEQLLHGRNQVAHGEIIKIEPGEALERIDGVLLLMDEYANQLIDAVRDQKFLLDTNVL